MDKAEVVRDTLHKIYRMERFNQWLFENIKPFLGRRILDAGCGSAFQSALLSTLSNRIIATDIFKENKTSQSLGIDRAQSLISRLNIKNITFVSCSAVFLPFVDNYFDFVFSSSVLEHINDKNSALSEMKRVLKPNGYLIMIVPTHMASLYAFPHLFLYLLARILRLNLNRGNGYNIDDTYSNDIQKPSLIKRFKMYHRSFPLPEPHGNYKNIFQEIRQQFPWAWKRLLEENGFQVVNTFSTCLIPWLLLEPFSTRTAARLYQATKGLHLGRIASANSMAYLVCFVAIDKNR